MSKRGNDSGSNNALKLDKSGTRMSQRGGYAKMRNHERLSGGADAKSKSNTSASKSAADANAKVTPVIPEISEVRPDAEDEIESILENSNPDEEEKGTGDKKVNELIDYVIHNLQEAGKALASLGDDFEQDLKLMFDDIVKKMKSWASEAQLRLDEANNNLDDLRGEFTRRATEIASRDREIADLRGKLDELKASNIAAAEKALEENLKKKLGRIESSSQTTATSPKTPNSTHSVDTKSIKQSDVQLATESGAPIIDKSVAEIGSTSAAPISSTSGAQISAPSTAQTPRPTSGTLKSVPSGAQMSAPSAAQTPRPTSGTLKSILSSAQIRAPSSTQTRRPTSGTLKSVPSSAQTHPSSAQFFAPFDDEFGTDSGAQKRALFDAETGPASRVEFIDESGPRSSVAKPEAPKQCPSADDRIGPGVTASGVTVEKPYVVPSTQDERYSEKIAHNDSQKIVGTRGDSEMFVDSRSKSSNVEKSHEVSDRLERSQGKFSRDQFQQSGSRFLNLLHAPSETADVAVQWGKSKERVKRISDLSLELSRLKKENERIIKEKADYENAIQRALLRGVSSLNAETLKVLKVSPLACCTPCSSSLSPADADGTSAPGSQRSTHDDRTLRGGRTSVNGSQSIKGVVRDKSNMESHPEQASMARNAKTSSNGTSRTDPKQKKSPTASDSSMVFLLHKADASSICASNNASKVRSCGRAKSKKLENSVCVRKLG